jgi:hypothetical protein
MEDAKQQFDGIVQRAVEKYHDIDKAVKAAMKAINADDEMREALLGYFIQRAVRDAIHARRHIVRSIVKANPPRSLLAMADAGESLIESILDSYMIDGKRIGDVTGAELQVYIQTESEIANGHRRNANFYGMLRNKTPDDKLVRECVKPDEASEMAARAFQSKQQPTTGKRASIGSIPSQSLPFAVAVA